MREVVKLYRGSLARRLMPNLIGAIVQKRELAKAVRDGFLAGRRSALAEVLRRGIERGDLRARLRSRTRARRARRTAFYRLLVTGGPLDDRLADDLTAVLLRAIAQPPT
jgi:hypothetical protein